MMIMICNKRMHQVKDLLPSSGNHSIHQIQIICIYGHRLDCHVVNLFGIKLKIGFGSTFKSDFVVSS